MTDIPNFDLIKLIGKGAYGEVWMARDVNHLNTDRFRAIKIVRRGDTGEERPYEREYEGVEQYEPISREHEGLVDILQVGLHVDEGFFFYVMELADDCNAGQDIAPDSYNPRTLQHDLETRGRLPFGECVKTAKALAEGLSFLHAKDLVHRDIKPTNIISVNGRWKYADTGLVAGAGEDSTIVGTLGYLPPEGSGKPAADIFSLGKVMYQVCTGMDSREFPDLPAGFDGLGDPLFRKLNAIYLKACEYNPEARYQGATEIVQDLAESTISAESTIHPSPLDGQVRILIVDEKGGEIDSFSLGNGEHIIGRKGHTKDVPIDDKSVSRTHAKLIIAGGQVEIEDLKSTYGISMEGKAITGRAPIHPGEKIRVGLHFILLDAGGETVAAPPSEDSQALGDGRYTLLKKLGRGSFGEVWRMWDNELEEDVAAKLLTDEMVDESGVANIKREVQKTRRLTHENIVRLYDFCSYPDEPPFLTMEFIDGHSLETHRLNRSGNIFPWEELKPLMEQLCNAVDYIHEKGIVHRDIKPANIIVDLEGQIKLGDFGCARSMIISRFTMGEYAGKGSLVLRGTLVYMSPQILDGEEPSAKDDIYAIGVMLYELLTGQTPFALNQGQEKLMEEIINAMPVPPAEVIAGQGVAKPIPDYVSSLIMSCLSKDPAMRPGNARLITSTFY